MKTKVEEKTVFSLYSFKPVFEISLFMLDQHLLKILCDPYCHQTLTEQNGYLVTANQETSYPIVKGIPNFLSEGDVTGDNLKYQKFYDKVGVFTSTIFWTFCRLFRVDTVSQRKGLLSDLYVKPGDRVLETSIGAGANIPPLNPHASYVGLDISMGMLKACQKYPLLQSYNLQLVQGNAEYLPFIDDSFDLVFHVGGINFFNNKERAIIEMIRVAKPGAKILVADETQKHVDSYYKKIPFISRYFKDVDPIVIPIDLVPMDMLNLDLAYKWNDSMYVITFNKPQREKVGTDDH